MFTIFRYLSDNEICSGLLHKQVTLKYWLLYCLHGNLCCVLVVNGLSQSGVDTTTAALQKIFSNAFTVQMLIIFCKFDWGLISRVHFAKESRHHWLSNGLGSNRGQNITWNDVDQMASLGYGGSIRLDVNNYNCDVWLQYRLVACSVP